MSKRWKSVLGAALAATSFSVSALPAAAQSQDDMTFHTVPPCTVVDTRVAGGAFAANETRAYTVTGNGSLAAQGGSALGCGVPGFSNGIAQAQAVALVLTVVNPAGPGYLTANAADQAMAGAVLTFLAGDLPSSTSQVAVAQASGLGDVKILVAATSAHVVARVVGYYSKPVQTVHVHPVPGDPAASGAALLNAVSGITNASAIKRYVVKVEPGIYDLGETGLVMKPYVDVEGSGQGATVLRGQVEAQELLNHGVVETAASSELRDLLVDCNGSDVCILVPEGADTWVHHVTVTGDDALFSRRFFVVTDGAPRIEDVTVRGEGGFNSGLRTNGQSQISLRRSRFEFIDGLGTLGLDLSGTTSDVDNVQIAISGGGTGLQASFAQITLANTSIDVDGGTAATGIHVLGGSLQITDSRIQAGGANATGIFALCPVTVEGSRIIASMRTILVGQSGTGHSGGRIAGSRLEGGPVVGTVSCAFVWDETFTPFAGPACP